MTNLTELTIEELYLLNMPFFVKVSRGEKLEGEDKAQHLAIIREVDRRIDALRASELTERAERFAVDEPFRNECGQRLE